MKKLIFFKLDKDYLNNQKTDLKNIGLFSDYYAEYYKEYQDLSFGVSYEDRVIGYVLCCSLENKICLPNDGVKIILESNSQKNTKLYKEILDYLTLLAIQNDCTEIIIKDSLLNGSLSSLGETLFNNAYCSKITFEMLIDYKNFDETSYHKNLRKSYKSLINWGRNNLKFIYINKENACFKTFQTFKDFHLKIAGNKTRSDESWNLQYTMLEQGFGELGLAYYEDNLVAGSLFVDFNDVSIYFTGVYERDLFHLGISHYLLYNGICRLHEKKLTSAFSLGYFDTDIQDQKWYNIQFFKKGFCEKLTPVILWSKLVKE